MVVEMALRFCDNGIASIALSLIERRIGASERLFETGYARTHLSHADGHRDLVARKFIIKLQRGDLLAELFRGPAGLFQISAGPFVAKMTSAPMVELQAPRGRHDRIAIGKQSA